jgi:hypothetical protein
MTRIAAAFMSMSVMVVILSVLGKNGTIRRVAASGGATGRKRPVVLGPVIDFGEGTE